jgi:hypothetical protein
MDEDLLRGNVRQIGVSEDGFHTEGSETVVAGVGVLDTCAPVASRPPEPGDGHNHRKPVAVGDGFLHDTPVRG